MEALKAEIERKRKASADAAAAAAGSGGPRKWMKASEREKVREAEYHAETAKEQERAKAKQVMPQFRYAQPDSSMSGGASSSADATEPAADSAAAKAKAAAAATEAAKALRPIEVRRLLRNLGQPIQLFGEEEADRLERYQAVSKILPSESEANDELKAGQMFDERQRFDESGKAIQKAAASEEHTQADEDAEGETLEELAGSGFVPSTPEDIVLVHFKTLVRMWEAELAARTEEEAGSLAGRTATGAFQQCKRHMKPFYKLLKAREMPLDVMGTMVEITTFMKSREWAANPEPHPQPQP